MMPKFIVSLRSLSVSLMLVACSSTPPVTEFPITADPKVELERVDAGVHEALGNQVNLFAPINFKKATDKQLDKSLN